MRKKSQESLIKILLSINNQIIPDSSKLDKDHEIYSKRHTL